MKNVRGHIATLVDRRENDVVRDDLDRAFSMPSAVWEQAVQGDFADVYKHVRGGDESIFDRLRFYTQSFTGYQLQSLQNSRGLRSINAIPANFDQQILPRMARPDQWTGYWIDATRELPRRYVFSPPPILGEIGWEIDGVIVNHDTYAYQERLNILYETGILPSLEERSKSRVVTILEIGGGYGALALAVSQIISNLVYIICDIPESLQFSGMYLSGTTTRPVDVWDSHQDFHERPGFWLAANYHFDRVKTMMPKIDLAINTLSMAEMSTHQVHHYAVGIKGMIGSSGIFFEQNQDNRHIGGLDCKSLLTDHFQHAEQVISRRSFCVHGKPTLWANAPVRDVVPSHFIPAPPRRSVRKPWRAALGRLIARVT